MTERIYKITGYFIFILLTSGTIFFTSRGFVQEHTLPKVYCFIFCSFLLSLVCLFFDRKLLRTDMLTVFVFLFTGYLLLHSFYYPVQHLNRIILLSFLFLYISLKQRNNINSGFINTGIVTACLLQALYGLSQYTGLIYSSSSFPITGSFDNPAGFAACLSAGFPFVFGLFKESKYLRALGIATALFILFAIILSGSRTGIICILLVTAIYIYHRFIKKKVRLDKLFWGLVIAGSIALFAGLVYLKKDSASGRLLIWEVTVNMIKDNPVSGSGGDSFNTGYMLFQAGYFREHPDSMYAILADNVLHPFNEYLLLTVEYGFTGILLLLGCVLTCVSTVIKNKINILSPYLLCLLSIASFSCFSYPFKYPFVWFLLALSLARLSKTNTPVLSFRLNHIITKAGFTGIFITGLFLFCKDIRFEYKWKQIARLSSLGKTSSVISDYADLYSHWNGNPLFLYNYGAELNHLKDYSKSISILHECKKYYNDYDVQLLLADNYFNQEKWGKAKEYYNRASCMCPNRFIPLNYLHKIAILENNTKEAQRIALSIMDKPIKIPSATIHRIKFEMREYLENRESPAW